MLQRNGVKMLAGVEYVRIDDTGLHITVNGEPLCRIDSRETCQPPSTYLEMMLDLNGVGSSYVPENEKRCL